MREGEDGREGKRREGKREPHPKNHVTVIACDSLQQGCWQSYTDLLPSPKP